jgi:aspartate aminotransferase-like enzyme
LPRPEIILAPGPTAVPPQVLLAQGSPLVYHRGPGYGALLRDVTESLQKQYRTKNDVVVFASSGTGGLESSVSNLFSPGDRVVVPVAGYFGERFAKIARAYRLDVRTIDYEWGRAVDPSDVAAALDEAPAKGVLVQQSETSTGVIHDVEAIAKVTKERGALIVVDAVSSLGAVAFETDGWGIDAAISGSQKALSATPGLAFVAISLMQGLHAALELYFEDGPEAALKRHEMLSRAVKNGVRALGLDLFGEHPERAWAVTAIRAPEGIDGNELVARVRSDHGIILAPGQGPLKGKVFRIGHLGYYDAFDIIRGLAALELTLEAMGYPVKRGAAVAAAEDVFSGS